MATFSSLSKSRIASQINLQNIWGQELCNNTLHRNSLKSNRILKNLFDFLAGTDKKITNLNRVDIAVFRGSKFLGREHPKFYTFNFWLATWVSIRSGKIKNRKTFPTGQSLDFDALKKYLTDSQSSFFIVPVLYET